MTMGPICDACNGAFQEGDTVYLTAFTYWDDQKNTRKWATSRGHCADDAIAEASDVGGINAVVRAELGPAVGEGFLIYNPEVLDVRTPEGYGGDA